MEDDFVLAEKEVNSSSTLQKESSESLSFATFYADYRTRQKEREEKLGKKKKKRKPLNYIVIKNTKN